MASTSSEPTDELATAVGRYVLGERSLGRAAEEVGMSRWEFEEVLENAGFTSLYAPRTDDLAARRLADELDIPVTGFIGLLVVGIEHGRIDRETADEWLKTWRDERGYYAPVESVGELLDDEERGDDSE